ncbi:MAG: CaiB/BaiF CoA transferase family protein, partial [Nocardioidaceae bacterium]
VAPRRDTTACVLLGRSDWISMPGPLTGLRVLTLPAIGPVPHAAMVLADLGADVVQVRRPDRAPLDVERPLRRSQRHVLLDLKTGTAVETLLAMVVEADVLIEGFRPGVAERLGLGPAVCLDRNPRLIYARMTGWGQEGPLAQHAGHDINYLSISGPLHAIGRAGAPPVVPLNLVADFGGGSMLLLTGVLSALWERERSHRGQVIDTAMVDGASLLMQMTWGAFGSGAWRDTRGANLLDGGAPCYDTYACSDGEYVAVGALEPQFFAALLRGLSLDGGDVPDPADRESWPQLRERIASAFATRTRDEWGRIFADTDACVTPVLGLTEVARNPQIRARNTIIDVDGAQHAAPAPRFSRTTLAAPTPAADEAADPVDVLAEWQSKAAPIEPGRTGGHHHQSSRGPESP